MYRLIINNFTYIYKVQRFTAMLFLKKYIFIYINIFFYFMKKCNNLKITYEKNNKYKKIQFVINYPLQFLFIGELF